MKSEKLLSVGTQLKSLEEDYIEFTKTLSSLEELNNELQNASIKSYHLRKQNLKETKLEGEDYTKKISSKITAIKNLQLSDNEFKLLQKINNKFKEKQSEYNRIVEELNEKEQNFIDNNDAKSVHSSASNNISIDNIQVKEYKDNVLIERQKEIENIKILSGQVREISDSLRMETDKQGTILNDIESNVKEGFDNVVKGSKEIKEVEQMTKGQNKKIGCLIWIIIIIILIISVVLFKLFN